MQQNKKRYLLTVKEFSELTHTSIDALKYYDRINILKPAMIGENRYRYYKPEQALQLTRILFGVRSQTHLSDIRETLLEDDPSKTVEKYQEIYEKIERNIREMRALQKKLVNIIYYFDIFKKHEQGKLFITHMPENFILYSPKTDSDQVIDDSVSSLANDLFIKEFRNEQWPHFLMGYFYPEEKIKQYDFSTAYYFLRTDHPENYQKEETLYFPKGRYVCYLATHKNKLAQYLRAVKNSSYQIQGNIYVLGIISSLLTADPARYCTMLFAKLKK